jgi:hypothetical protein
MRVLDVFGGAVKKSQELGALGALYNRLQPHLGNAEERRNKLCRSAVASAFNLAATDPLGVVGRAAYQLCQTLLALEGHLYLPSVDINKQRTMAQVWELTATMQRALIPFEEENKRDIIIAALTMLLQRLTNGLPQITVTDGDEWASLSVPLYVLLPDPAKAIESALWTPRIEQLVHLGFFERLRERLDYNIYIASGIDPNRPEESRKEIVMPRKADVSTDELVAIYLDGTPLADFLQTPLPFSIPLQARFEHMHIVGGSGHARHNFFSILSFMILRSLRKGRGVSLSSTAKAT